MGKISRLLLSIFACLILINGCVSKNVMKMKFDSTELNSKVDKVLSLEEVQCENLMNKKIYINKT